MTPCHTVKRHARHATLDEDRQRVDTRWMSSAHGIRIVEHRYNAKCRKCGAAHSVMAAPTGVYVAFDILKTAGLLGHAGVYFSSHVAVLAETGGTLHLEHEGGIARTCLCGRELVLRRVRGIVNADKKCDARCTHATGHDCECACGGKNHGAANAA